MEIQHQVSTMVHFITRKINLQFIIPFFLPFISDHTTIPEVHKGVSCLRASPQYAVKLQTRILKHIDVWGRALLCNSKVLLTGMDLKYKVLLTGMDLKYKVLLTGMDLKYKVLLTRIYFKYFLQGESKT